MIRSIIAGFLGLAAMDVVVSSQASADRVGGLLGSAATVIQHILSPTVPAIPDLRKQAPAASGGGGSSSVGGGVTADPFLPDGSGGLVPAPGQESSTGGSRTLPATWTTSPPPPSSLLV